MIVLDEQLLGREIEKEIATWYRGKVQLITDFRPNTVIKDDAMPELLRRQNKPTFVTINVDDFWRKIGADLRYCVVCFDLPDSHIKEIPTILRLLFRHSTFDTKEKRMGNIVRIAHDKIMYYSLHQRDLKTMPLSVLTS